MPLCEFYHNLHTGRGVKIHVNTACSGFEGSGSVERVLCEGKSIEADLVIVGIGIIPNTELAADAGLLCENGILVNDHCQTSDENIYAAGDCTSHPNPILGRRLRLESVPNAMDQARTATANMLGGDKVYATVPWFWSDQYELKLQMVGFSTDGDTQVVRGDKEANQFAVFYLKDGAVVAVDAVNSPREFMVAKQYHPFLKFTISKLQSAKNNFVFHYARVQSSTGPLFLTRCYDMYPTSLKMDIYKISIMLYRYHYFHHITGDSWQKWDMWLINWWLAYLVYLLVILLLVTICVVKYKSRTNIIVNCKIF